MPYCCRGVLVSVADQNLPLHTCKNPSAGLQGALSHTRQGAVGFNGKMICPHTWVALIGKITGGLMVLETKRGKSGELNIPYLFQHDISQHRKNLLQTIPPTQTLFLRGILTYLAKSNPVDTWLTLHS